MNATDIVAYTYAADVYHPDCLVEQLIARGEANPVHRTYQVEATLDSLAADWGLDRDDEPTYDSGHFPKVVLASDQDTWDHPCGHCRKPIVEDDPTSGTTSGLVG
jgi:hypothetical protein